MMLENDHSKIAFPLIWTHGNQRFKVKKFKVVSFKCVSY